MARDVCWLCGGKLIWQSDYNPEDFGHEEDTPGIIACLLCSSCGADVQYTLIEGEENRYLPP
jgi:hypothetical protein